MQEIFEAPIYMELIGPGRVFNLGEIKIYHYD